MGLYDLTDLVLQRGLQGAGLRQQVLTNNLANANTAGFKRSDVDFQSSLLAALDGGGSAGKAVEQLAFTPQTDNTTTMRADGNNVDADQETSSMTENAVAYEAMLSIHHVRVQMLKMAMGGGA